MKLSRVQVSDFRKLTRVVIEDLAPGLNVIVGDNEAGKSTLLAAMRAALFERHRITGQLVDEMLPYGRQVRPAVEIDFSMGGAHYRLLKAFASKPEARLIGAGQEWEGDAADEALAGLLGFTRPGRGESKPNQHHGAFGMLWVSQGTAHQTPSIGAIREQVAGAIEREVGQVAGGEHGRSLLQLAAERQAAFWDKLRRPRGDYRKSAEELAALRVQRDSVRERLRGLEADVERLGQINSRLETYTAEGTLGRARQAVEAANRQVLALGSLQQQVATATDAVMLAELGQRSAGRELSGRRDLIEAARQATVALTGERQAAAEASAQLDGLQAAVEQARAADLAAMATEQAARQVLRKLEAAVETRRLRDFVDRARQQLKAAETLEQRRVDVAAAAAATRIDAAAMQRLEGLSSAIGEARSRLEAASVRLRLRPQFGGAAEIEGSIIEATELVISHDTTVHLFGFGDVDIRPGGGVTDLELAMRSAQSELIEALAQLGQTDIAAARASWERSKAAKQELPSLSQSLAALAPEGLERLRLELALRTANLEQMADDVGDVSAEQLEAAKRQAESSAQAVSRTRDGLALANNAINDARARRAVATDREATAQRLDSRACEALDAARLTLADVELEALEAAADTTHQRALGALDAARTQLRLAEPDLVQLRYGKEVKALEAIAADIERLQRDQLQLDAALRTQGREGLGEQLAQLDGDVTEREARLERQHVEARAATLLSETLLQAQRETKERWLRPIHDRAAPYLALLQPGSEIALDDDTLELDAVRRDGVAEAFSGLSMGAREQIAVITRLALADILADAGHNAAIVLDDPLVNADERRLERMHLVLHKAAERHQIVILTCRERDFLNLGARLIRI